MSRPALLPLPDEQVTILVRALQPLLAQYSAEAPSHRPFVREFIAAVYKATGRTFSPVIYRKLLAAHAPGRNPSTETLASEKKLFEQALTEEADAGRALDENTSVELGAVVQRAVDTAMARQGRAPQLDPAVDRYVTAQCDFLQERLTETEKNLYDVRAQAARLAGELQAAIAVRDALHAQVAAGAAQAAEQAKQIKQMTEELAGLRKFAMEAIEGSRGETRAQKERAAHLESLLKTEKTHTEIFRRLAYRSGAPIPDSLLASDKP